MENIIHKSSRAFNRVTIDQKYGRVHKRSKNYKKLLAESYWYKNIPAKIGSFAPKLLWEDQKASEIVMEYCPYITLSEAFVAELDLDWKRILERLFEVHSILNSQHVQQRGIVSDIKDFHLKKSEERIHSLSDIEPFGDLLREKFLTINNRVHRNIDVNFLLGELEKNLQHIKPSVVHGDYCFSNILYDLNSNSVKLIDPRGCLLGEPTIFGDAHYDYAKLMHSALGLYDFIVQGKYSLLQLAPDSFSFEIETKNQKIHSLILLAFKEDCKYESKEVVYYRLLLEVLLFVTMIPLHYEDPKRQLAFYLRAVQLYNQLAGVSI